MRILKSVGVFFLSIIVFYVFALLVFPVDESTNTLLAPNWFVIIMTVVSALIAASCQGLWKRKKRKATATSKAISGNIKHGVFTICRKSSWLACMAKLHCYIDGELTAHIKNGETVSVSVPEKVVVFECRYTMNPWSTPIYIDFVKNETATALISVSLSGKPKVELSCTRKTYQHKAPSFTVPVNTLAGKGIETNISVQEKDPLEVIRKMEQQFEKMYQYAYSHLLNAEDCRRAYRSLEKMFPRDELPLAAQIRLEQLCDEYKVKFETPNPMVYIDSLSGKDFEEWCAQLIRKNGFKNVVVTPGSGDHGVDIVAEKEEVLYAIQCKRYTSDVGNTPIQEVYAGKEMYNCQVAAVMTNQHFTDGAKALATKTRVLLWDREKIMSMMQIENQI